MKTRIWSLLALILALCLVLTACSSNGDDEIATNTNADPAVVANPEPSSPTGDVDSQEDAPTLASVESPEPVEPGFPVDVEVNVDTNTGIDVGVDLTPEGIFAGATAALEALETYRFSTTFLFTGQEDGAIESGSIELTGEIMGAKRKHFVWRDLGNGDHFEIIQLGSDAWVYDEGEWTAVPALVADAMSQAVLVFAPSVAWGGMFGGLETNSTYVGPVTINDIPAHHYTASYQQWAGVWEGEVLDATGDVWIAEAGYPLRYKFTATGIDDDGGQGTVSWTMELTDVGENIVIEPPTIVEPSS